MTDIQYVAGLFDGEGYVGIKRNKTPRSWPCYSLCCAVSMTDSGPVKAVAELFPARLYVEGRKTKSGRLVTSWHISGQKAVAFLEAIEPHVIGKKEQVRLVLEYSKRFSQKYHGSRRRTQQEKNEQETYFQKLQSLKAVDYGT